MRNRLVARPIKDYTTSPTPRLEIVPIITGAIAGGIHSEIDPSDIDNGELTLATNASIRMDKIARRPGSTLLNTKPNSSQIVGLANFKDFTGNDFLTRFATNSIHWNNSGAWIAVTGSGLTGTVTDRVKICALNGRFFFTNGVNPVSELNFTANTYSALTLTDKYRYIVGFHERIVVANKSTAGSPNPVQIAWSGILNFNEFNPTNDISAGSQPLVESATDYSDHITGLFAFSSQLLILRENSIWLANKQASAAQPFYFYNAVPSIGCDCGDSVAQVPGGIVWYNAKLANVFVYTLGSEGPTPIGYKVQSEMRNACESPELVVGSYNNQTSEYTLVFNSLVSSSTRAYVYNFINKSWSLREYSNLTYLGDIEANFSSGTIGGLGGTIEQLVGTISQLSFSKKTSLKLLGMSNGDILYEDSLVDNDNATAFGTTIRSKNYQLESDVQSILELRLEMNVSLASTFAVEYSIDGGETFILYRNVTLSPSTKKQLAVFKKNIRTRNFQWQLRTPSGQIEITKYELFAHRSGEQRSNS